MWVIMLFIFNSPIGDPILGRFGDFPSKYLSCWGLNTPCGIFVHDPIKRFRLAGGNL